MRRLDRWELACVVLIVIGLGLRLELLGNQSIDPDAAEYATMARTLVEQGAFILPWEEDLTYTQHFPPLFPSFIALFFAIFGRSFAALKLASITAAALFVLVVYFCSRDLYGRRPALAIAAVAAAMPTLYRYDSVAMSETFVAMLFALTIWAILRSLDRPAFIVLAGLFAGLSFLAKASMGPFFLIAAAGGFLWRFAYVRWAVFKDKWYLLGGLVFGSLVLPWSLRNVIRHGWPNWQTQRSAQEAMDVLFASDNWPFLVLAFILWVGFLVALQCLPFLPGLKTIRGHLRDERTTGLILAIVTPILVAGFFIAAFSLKEDFNFFDLRVEQGSDAALRYAVTPIVPMLWLSMRALDFSSPPNSSRRSGREGLRWALVGLGTAAIALAIMLRYPWIPEPPSMRRSLIFFVSAGLVLIAAARWLPAAGREGEGPKQMRSRAPRTERHLPLALGASVLAAAAFFLPIELLAIGIAGAAAALVIGWRARVVVASVILLSWSLGGYSWVVNLTDIHAYLEENALEGDTLTAPPSMERFFYPFLPEKVTMVPWLNHSEWRVDLAQRSAEQGYNEVLEPPTRHDLRLGGEIRYQYEKARGNEVTFPAGFALYIRQDVSTGRITE